jgi:hypothetical protein
VPLAPPEEEGAFAKAADLADEYRRRLLVDSRLSKSFRDAVRAQRS